MLSARIRRVERAVLFIESRLFEAISADDVARAVGGSVSELHRLFTDVYGIPLIRYLRGRRLSEGAAMLRASDRGVLEVATLCGYGSQAAFTRAFRRQFGVSPGRYRQDAGLPYRRMAPATLPSLLHRSGLDRQPRLHWVHDPVSLVGLVRTVDLERTEDFTALAVELAAHVPPNTLVTGQLLQRDGGVGQCFLGSEVAAPGLADRATLHQGFYAVFQHRGPSDLVRETLAHIAQTWTSDLLRPGVRPDVERFHLGDLQAPTLGVEFWLAVEGA